MKIDQNLWRGRSIMTRKDNSGKFKIMTGKNSILFIPVNVDKNSEYEISITCVSESGNGKFMCNFYANKNYDFEQKLFECSNQLVNIKFNLCTGEFPKSLPIVFRIWRPDNATGNLIIKNINIKEQDDLTIEIEKFNKKNNNPKATISDEKKYFEKKTIKNIQVEEEQVEEEQVEEEQVEYAKKNYVYNSSSEYIVLYNNNNNE